MPSVLAQNIQVIREQSGSILFWLAMLAAAAVLLAVIGLWLRRRYHDDRDDSEPIEGFGLADLRRLHAQGQLSDEEFERAKAMMIARTRRVVDGSETAPTEAAADDEDAHRSDKENSGDSSDKSGG